jgi:hypothetical protein
VTRNRFRDADADKEHMATAEQVETLMEGLSMLDVHLQVPQPGVRLVRPCSMPD